MWRALLRSHREVGTSLDAGEDLAHDRFARSSLGKAALPYGLAELAANRVEIYLHDDYARTIQVALTPTFSRTSVIIMGSRSLRPAPTTPGPAERTRG